MIPDLPEFAERRCAKCPQTVDLCPLGQRDYCPKHYREAIADLELRRSDYQPPRVGPYTIDDV